MVWKIIVDVVILVLTLVFLWFAFGIKQRLSGRLATAGTWGILAIIVFSLYSVATVLEGFGIASIGQLEKITHIIFIGLLVIASWNILKTVREVDGEIKTDGKIKIRKR